MRSNVSAILTGCLLLAGCSEKPAPQIVMVEPEKTKFDLPEECVLTDPAWVKLPEKDVTQAEAARNYATNKLQYRKVLNRRSVCRAAVNAYRKG